MADQFRTVEYTDSSLFTPGKRIRIDHSVIGEIVDITTDPDVGDVITLIVEGGTWSGLTRDFLIPRDDAQDNADPGITVYTMPTEPLTESYKSFFVRGPSDGDDLTDGSKWLYLGDGWYQCYQSGVGGTDGKGTFVLGSLARLNDIWPIKRAVFS